MTLLTSARNVCDVIGLSRPAAIITGTDQLSRQILGLAVETLDELSMMDWPILSVPYSFNTVVGQSAYDLPADFLRELGDTVYVASQYSSLRGSLTPGDWARQRDSLEWQYGRYRFRIFGLPPKINLTPSPQVVEQITLEYQTTYKVKQSNGTYKDTFYDDADTPIVPEDLFKKGLKWRLRRAKGLDYSEEFDDYEKDRFAQLAQTLQLGSMPVAYRQQSDMPEGLNVYIPQSGFGV
jgi:hypothetical protein